MRKYKDYYAILGVSPSADEKEIKRVWKGLRKLYHPDPLADATENDRKHAEEKFKDLSDAFDILSDPEKRRDHDTKRKEELERRRAEEKTGAEKATSFARIRDLFESGDIEGAVREAKSLYARFSDDADCQNCYAALLHKWAMRLAEEGELAKAAAQLRLAAEHSLDDKLKARIRADLELLRAKSDRAYTPPPPSSTSRSDTDKEEARAAEDRRKREERKARRPEEEKRAKEEAERKTADESRHRREAEELAKEERRRRELEKARRKNEERRAKLFGLILNNVLPIAIFGFIGFIVIKVVMKVIEFDKNRSAQIDATLERHRLSNKAYLKALEDRASRIAAAAAARTAKANTLTKPAPATQSSPAPEVWYGLKNPKKYSVTLTTNWSVTIPRPPGMSARVDPPRLRLEVRINGQKIFKRGSQLTSTDTSLEYRLINSTTPIEATIGVGREVDR